MNGSIDTLQSLMATLPGNVGDQLLRCNMDPGVLRPWLDAKGRSCVTLADGFDENRKPKARTVLTTNNATLMKDQWIEMDEALVRAARPAMRVWSDIVGAGLTYNIPNGMGVTMLQHQTMTDAGEASLSMDGLRETMRDRTAFDIASLPLPIVHSDFFFSLRELEVARRQRMPLDTTMIEQNTRKCVELIEKLTIGSLASYSYGGGTVYGLTNYPDRLTKVLTAPTAPGWTPNTTLQEVLSMIQSMQDVYFNGPYMAWYSPAWTQYLDNDYSATYGGKSLRQRLADVKDITTWNKADYLSGFQIVIAEKSPWVVQAVTGMKLKIVQWDMAGGLERRFKILGIMVPRIRSNSDGNTGICHGSAA